MFKIDSEIRLFSADVACDHLVANGRWRTWHRLDPRNPLAILGQNFWSLGRRGDRSYVRTVPQDTPRLNTAAGFEPVKQYRSRGNEVVDAQYEIDTTAREKRRLRQRDRPNRAI